MSYYFTASMKDTDFEEARAKVIHELKNEGFGILTEIDMKSTLKEKLDVDFYNYHILGACNPPFAYEALQTEDKIGTMLPCNVIVQEKERGTVEVSIVDPIESMRAVRNEHLAEVAEEVRDKLKKVVEKLKKSYVKNQV